MVNKITIFLLTFNLCFLCAKAQNDYVITLNNDTLRGNIKDNTFKTPKFSRDGEKKSIYVNSQKFKEYYVFSNRKNYVAKKIPAYADSLFIERIERGKIELYEMIFDYSTPVGNGVGGYRGMNTNRNITWYVSKEGLALITLKHNSWATFSKSDRKNAFHEMLKDNQKVSSVFLAEDKFSFDKIRELIILYNMDSQTKGL